MATVGADSPYWDGNIPSSDSSLEGIFGDIYGNQGTDAKDAGDMVGNKPIQSSYPQVGSNNLFQNVGSFADSTNIDATGGSWMNPFYSSNSDSNSAFSPDFLSGSGFDSATPVGYDTQSDFPSYGDYNTSSADNRTALNASNAEYNAQPGEEDGILKKYKDAVSPFQGLLKNPLISTLMSLHPATAALKTLLGGPTSVGGFLGSMLSSNPIGRMAGALGGSQLANYATDGEFAPMSNGNVGGMAGSFLGNMTGNPYGSFLGGQAGKMIGDLSNQSYGQSSFMPGEMGGMPGGGMGSFGNQIPTGMNNGVYGALGNIGMAANTNRSLGNQIGTLEGLFGQNSPYAQQMRQALERKDAAAGRRSQYGTREVELQAALAGQAARLQPGLQQLYAQKNNNQNLLVQSLMRNPNLMSGVKEGWQGLTNLFTQQPTAPQTFMPEPDNSGFDLTGGGG